MIILPIICLIAAIYCFACSQLQMHGQLKWGKDDTGFWGTHSNERKYRFPFLFSKTLLVFLTDGYHLMQFMFFNFIALSLTLAIGWNWWLFGGLLVGIRIVHFSARKIFSK